MMMKRTPSSKLSLLRSMNYSNNNNNSLNGKGLNLGSNSSQQNSSSQQPQQQMRVIMLGTGGVGKSTLFKNIKLLFNGGFDSDEFLSYREVILSNIVQMVQFVLRALITLFPEHKIEKPENEEFANSILRLDCEDFIHILRIVDENFITRVQKLWFEEPAILRAYHYRHRYQLPVEDLPDLIKQMDQIYSLPKTKHVMSSYVKTTGIVETECVYRNTRIRVFDTGGQRNERKKWVHLFGSTNGIIFIVSLSEYNQVCYEDDKSNRMKESLLLFEEIVNASCFERVPIFLVFNKKDVFLHKIQYFDISEAFSDLPNHIRLHKPIKNFHKLANDAKRKHNIQQKKQRRTPGTLESAQNPKTMERFQRARSASIQKQKRKNSLAGVYGSSPLLPRMSPSRFVVENHHLLSEEEQFKIRQENWQKIPSDILIYICFFLDAVDMCTLSTVNYEMYIIATCDTVWRSLCYSLMKDIDEEHVDLLYKERYHLFEPQLTGKVNSDESPSSIVSSVSTPTTTTTKSMNSSSSTGSILTSSLSSVISSVTTDKSPSSISKAISIQGNVFSSFQPQQTTTTTVPGTNFTNTFNMNNNNGVQQPWFGAKDGIGISITATPTIHNHQHSHHHFTSSTVSIYSDSSSEEDPNMLTTTTTTTTSSLSFMPEEREEREFRKRKWRFFYEIGGYVYRDSIKYIQQQFIDLAKDEQRRAQLWRDVRVTSATNASTVRELLEYVFDTIIDAHETNFDFDEDLSPSTPSSKSKSPRRVANGKTKMRN
ncbi:hypothetical protein FDP41_002612 [Naegleria fowleri]|uniref:F-box domain-containing protein n=1 Tax=Naegleria fowleri TaxID=5763 RepID=A0A6A5BM37_NAEFO|nr:uncharacterized protein FDP41_002612 [Naegleria fowleri]KAF0978097.1 hypothetical protein FDP41_002612 [Naegleria fowleri]